MSRVLVGVVMTVGCAASNAQQPHVQIKQDYAVESTSRAALKTYHKVEPELDAARLLRVRVNHGYWGMTTWEALFYSDGTLQVDERAEHRTRRPSAKLTTQELQELSEGISTLDRCRVSPEQASLEHEFDGRSVTFEILQEPRHDVVIMHYPGSGLTLDCYRYEKFVVGLINETVEVDDPLPQTALTQRSPD
jgi:hypothetical protein